MKKLIVIALTLAVLIGGFQAAQAQPQIYNDSANIVLDSVNVEAIYSKGDAAYNVFEDFGDSVRTGQEIKMYFRYQNLYSAVITGATNGYEIYTVDGGGDGAATRGNLSAPLPDSAASAEGVGDFDDFWSMTFINYFGVDGIGYDTVTYGCFIIPPKIGMPVDYDDVSVVVHIGPIAEGTASHGDSLCVDTAFYPPGGEWLWAGAARPGDTLGGYSLVPDWGGPYCFYIIDEATDVVEIPGGELPETFALAQNYPNPFNPTTTISFDVGRTGHVKLDVYNVLGQRVETLIDRVMERGTYEADWDASSFSTGIYFYKLETESFSDTKKMLLLK